MSMQLKSSSARFSRTGAFIVSWFAASCAQEPDDSGDIIVSFPGTTTVAPALLLYSVDESSTCVSYGTGVANPTVTLHDVSVDPACVAEFEGFAPGFGAFGRDVDPMDATDVSWLQSAIDIGTLAITLPAYTKIPVKIWLVGFASQVDSMEAVRNRLLDKAYPVLATMGTGFTLDTASTQFDPSLIDARCNSADVISMNGAIYDASKINVYFVAHYGYITGLTPAMNCWQKNHPEISFVSWKNSHVTDPTLVHELGHALGLINPKALGGHTYLIPGFGPFNLMATNTDVADITIGQLYAMNFSSDSWINRPGSAFTKPVVKTCQDSWGTGVCPALTKMHAGWPP